MESQKITNSHLSKPTRWYQDACGTALAMDSPGERWSVLIMRELLLGPRRSGAILGRLVGLCANLLTPRPDRLDTIGSAHKPMLPSPAKARVSGLSRKSAETRV